MRIIDVDQDAREQRHAVITIRRRGGKLTFVLLPMSHMALPEFYEGIRQRLMSCDRIIFEGVDMTQPSWRDRIVATITWTYEMRRLRRRSGLARQDNKKLLPPGVPAERVDATITQVHEDLTAEFGRALYLIVPLLLLVALVMAIRGNNKFWLRRERPMDVPLPGYVPRDVIHATQMPDFMYRALCERRNKMLFTKLDRIDREHREQPLTVGVLYGAAHIADAYMHLFIRHGYRPAEPEWVTALRA